VTQEHELQQQLKDRLNFIEKLVESSIDRIMVLDRHLNYILWNKNCENYYGIKKEDIIGKNVLELFPMFKIDPIYQDCKKALNGENIHIPAKKTNENEYQESFLIPLKNEKAEVTGILWIIHDLSEILQAREQLVTSEAHLKTAQEIAHLGSWEYEHASGILSWSDEVYRIYGYEPGSFEPTIEFYKNTSHLDNRADIEALFAQPAKIYSFVNKIYTLDGRVRFVQTLGHPVLDEAGNNIKIIGTVQDITEQKILQDQLHEKNAAIRNQYENARHAEMMRHISTWQLNSKSGTIFWGENLFRILGYKPHAFEPTLERFISMVHPEDKEKITGAIIEIDQMEGGALPVFEYRVFDAEQKLKYVRSICRVVSTPKEKYVTGIMQDITTEVLQKQQLSWYHQLLETVVESCTDAISIYDHQLHCTSWNKGSEKLFGKTKADLLGKNLFDIFPGINIEQNSGKIREVMKGSDEVHLEEISVSIGNHTVICKPLVHGADENTGLLLITRGPINVNG
jgi:PAS domain S-box-containing protein